MSKDFQASILINEYIRYHSKFRELDIFQQMLNNPNYDFSGILKSLM